MLYGIVFAAACEFSKATRDLFRARTRAMGVAEAHLWGRGELEDMLYQPKNDDVLFTFFGVSLRIRRQSAAAEVRRRLVVKRKAMRLLDGKFGTRYSSATAVTNATRIPTMPLKDPMPVGGASTATRAATTTASTSCAIGA